MKIVVAPDSFKGSMRSDEAGEIIAAGLREGLPGAEIVVIPMADGGEGTTDAVVRATGGRLRPVSVTGPLGAPATAAYGVLPDGRTAVMEMASASGIELVPAGALDPMRASTVGTGELLRAAMDAGVRDIIIGIGGSATVDGGIGMAQALGFRLLTARGELVGSGGGALASIARVETSGVVPALAESRIRVACDVTNPLLGERGAARVFGPQKGASPAMVEELETGLAHLAEVWKRQGMLDSVRRPGDGAAGGLGAALRAFCGAEMASGAELVAEITGFDREIADADLLVTGEGRTDDQTADGKLCVVLARKAREQGARTILISGSLHGESGTVERLFDAVFAAVREVCTLEEALAGARINLARIARSVGRVLAVGARGGEDGPA
ncbi:MAG: glycerate kinase [Thermoanaerobaculales bacterium]|jgi:glycerate kinase|nr:glycerate kinase [Thermoanaerobaculales bacterium]